MVKRTSSQNKDVNVVSSEQLTRFYLQNHFLLHRAIESDLAGIASHLCGLHSQLPLTPYLSLWNRVENLESEILDNALYQDKALVKIWCMRGTLYTIPSADLPIYINALKRMWFEHHGRFMHSPEWPSREKRERLLHPAIVKALSEKPLRRKELDDKVRVMLKGTFDFDARVFSSWGGVLKETNYLGLTVHAEPCGRESCFAGLNRWLPHVDLNEIDEKEAREKLLLKYLYCYGPASAEDFACWSGLLTSEARKAVESTADKLKKVQVEEIKKELWMLKEDYRTLEKVDLEERAKPRLLPKFDSYLLGHKDRTRIIANDFLKLVFRPVVGDIAATILVNGRITGVWTHKKTKKKLMIMLNPFKKLNKDTLTEIEQIVKDLGVFMRVPRTTINQQR